MLRTTVIYNIVEINQIYTLSTKSKGIMKECTWAVALQPVCHYVVQEHEHHYPHGRPQTARWVPHQPALILAHQRLLLSVGAAKR